MENILKETFELETPLEMNNRLISSLGDKLLIYLRIFNRLIPILYKNSIVFMYKGLQ